MAWTIDLVTGVAANSLTALIGFALAFIVLGSSLRRVDNWLFAIFMLIYTVMGVTSVFNHFAQPLEFHPRQSIYLGTTLYAINIVLLFVVSARFAGISARTIAIVSGLGGIMLFFLLFQLWGDKVYVDFEPAASGAQYVYKLGPGGIPGLALLGVFQLLSAVLLYRLSNEQGRWLWTAPVIMLVGMLLFLVPLFDKFPKNALAISISMLIIARIVTEYQIFNPLAKLNRELEAANAAKSELLKELMIVNRELIEANRLKNKFLANMSHELRTPMNAIIGYSELMLAKTYGDLTDSQQNRLQRITRNARNLLALINDILDLSKIEADRLELSMAEVELPTTIQEVLSQITLQAEEKQLALTTDLADSLPPVWGDPLRIRQIVTNLVGNALKFTEEGGITIRASHDTTGGLVQVSVQDTGIGIAAADLPIVFDEFRQVDDSPARQYEGTGLGLAISKRLVEMMGGTIWVESELGQGSTFTFTLPCMSTQPAVESVRSAEQSRATGKMVVVIDDNPDAANLIRDSLSEADYQVLVAHDGQSGLDLIQRTHPDLVTLDIMMAGMSGWDVLTALRSDPATAAIPVVIVSIVEEQPVGLDVAVDGHITKPVDLAQLLDLVRTLTQAIPPDDPILIVDDQAADREILTQMLEMHGFATAAVTGGQAAIDWLGQSAAALVLLDLMMPQVSGFDVLHYLRAQSPHPQTPVIVVTAKDLTRPEQEFLSRRLADLVQKDGLHPADLLHRVRSTLVAQSSGGA